MNWSGHPFILMFCACYLQPQVCNLGNSFESVSMILNYLAKLVFRIELIADDSSRDALKEACLHAQMIIDWSTLNLKRT